MSSVTPSVPRKIQRALVPLSIGLALWVVPVHSQQPDDMPPPPVTVAPVETDTVDVEGVYAGRARGSREVEVRARVDGILEERLYVEGQVVDKGDALFRIDEEPYEIALRQAEAEQANAQAAYNQANREWQRISSLYEQDAVSQRERDRALSEFELAEAQLAMAQAAVRDAERNLRYTEVEAPLAGATGLEVLPEGSLIERGTLLTSITEHDPIHVRFALPEDDAAVQRAAREARLAAGDEHEYEAELRMPDGSTYPESGTVDFTDSTIDPRTGSVTARAVFPNKEHRIVPGQFLRVKLILEQYEDAVVVDEAVVSEGPEGPQVFVVDEEDKAQVRPVELGPVVDGRQIILSGLEVGERLVVNGHVALQDGMPVDVAEDQADEE